MRNGALLRDECCDAGRRQVPLRPGRVPEPPAAAAPLLRDRVFSRALRDDRARQPAPRARGPAGEGLRHHGAAELVARYGSALSRQRRSPSRPAARCIRARAIRRRVRPRIDAVRRACSRNGGLPVMSQPVAAASTARNTPLCVTRPCDSCSGARVALRSQRMTRSRTSRGLSPPGGRKSRPARFVARERLAMALAAIRRGESLPIRPSPSRSAPARTAARAPDRISAVSTARRNGLEYHGVAAGGTPATPACARHASTSARPRVAQRNIAAALHPAFLVPRRAAVAQECDDHRAAAGAVSRARVGRVLGARPDAAPRRCAPRRPAGRAATSHRRRLRLAIRRRNSVSVMQRSDRLGKRGGVAQRDQQARAIRRHHARDAAAVAGDHGQAARLRLDERHAERLVDRGPDEDDRCAQPCGHVRARPESRPCESASGRSAQMRPRRPRARNRRPR